MKAAVGAASVLLALAGGLSAVAAPEKPTPQPAMFTAYLPPAEEHCCTIALPGGRIGFGMLTIPDRTSVFVVDSTPTLICCTSSSPSVQAIPADALPIPDPDEF